MTPIDTKDTKNTLEPLACCEPDFLSEPQKSAEYEAESALHCRLSKILDKVYELNALAGNCPFPTLNDMNEENKPRLFRYRKEIARAFALQIALEKTIRAQLFVAPFYGIFTERSISRLEGLLEAKRYKAFSKYYISLLSKFDKPNPFLDSDIVGPIAEAPDADSAISNSMNLKHYCEGGINVNDILKNIDKLVSNIPKNIILPTIIYKQ